MFCERPFLKASCIVLLSTSTTAVLPLRKPGKIVVASLSTSCSANVSLTLMCALCYAAGKSTAALKTQKAPNGSLMRRPHSWDEVPGAPVMIRTCRVTSYHDSSLSRVRTSNHLSIPNRRPQRPDTAIGDTLLWPPERLSAVIWRYMWCIVPFPALPLVPL